MSTGCSLLLQKVAGHKLGLVFDQDSDIQQIFEQETWSGESSLRNEQHLQKVAIRTSGIMVCSCLMV